NISCAPGGSMADHATTPATGPESIEALTADREQMWHSFTSATTGGVIFVAVLLILMAFFLM
ncbi:MAG TPA: aa3-type cytochrome c oxidase subunit IV, partial [Rhodopila sp.]